MPNDHEGANAFGLPAEDIEDFKGGGVVEFMVLADTRLWVAELLCDEPGRGDGPIGRAGKEQVGQDALRCQSAAHLRSRRVTPPVEGAVKVAEARV